MSKVEGTILIYTPEKELPARKGNREIDGVLFKPGRNHIKLSEYDALMKSPDFKAYQNSGVIDLLLNAKEEAQEIELKETSKYKLAGLSAENAIKAIRIETSLMTLAQWREMEPLHLKRTTVINAISRQIKDIEEGSL